MLAVILTLVTLLSVVPPAARTWPLCSTVVVCRWRRSAGEEGATAVSAPRHWYFNGITFDTGGICPASLLQWAATQCLCALAGWRTRIDVCSSELGKQIALVFEREKGILLDGHRCTARAAVQIQR